MIAASATVKTVAALIAAGASDASIGHEIIALRRSEPFSLIPAVAPAYAAIAEALGTTPEKLSEYRDAFFGGTA